MDVEIRKAVFPVAGLGTRLLPATKAIPKELMTLVDRPLIEYAIDEARAAGIIQFIFVTARGKTPLQDHLDRAPILEKRLRADGKLGLVELLDNATMRSGAAAFIRQHEPLGLGHAVWCARHLVGDEAFAVILTDDVIASETPCLQQMIQAHRETGDNMVALMKVRPQETGSYGIVETGNPAEKISEVSGLVEKPEPSQAPSNLAIVGRYILTPQIMKNLDCAIGGARGEIQLTDALNAEATGSGKVYGYQFDGERFDCGSKQGFLRATVAFALQRTDLNEEFRAYLQDILQEPGATKDTNLLPG